MAGQGNIASPYGTGANGAVGLVARLTAILSISAGVLHVSAADDHQNLPVMMTGFLIVAVLQVALGALLLWRRPARPLIAAAIARSASPRRPRGA